MPFFLITTGYFLRVPNRLTPALVTQPLARLLPIYIVWMIVYYTFAYITKASPLLLAPRDMISGGTAFHLWYLPASGVAMVLVPVGVLTVGWRATGLVCAALGAVVIAIGTYHDAVHRSGEA